MRNTLIIMLLSSSFSFAQSKEDDKIIIGNRIYLNSENLMYCFDSKIVKDSWTKDSTIQFIQMIDKSLERFEDNSAVGFSDGLFGLLRSSYNSTAKFILIDFDKNWSNNEKESIAFPMYITQRLSGKIAIHIFQVEIRVAQPSIKRKYKTLTSKYSRSNLSYVYNGFLFKIRNLSEIPEPIMNVIHAND